MTGRLIVVANRVPLSMNDISGGLVTALHAALQINGGIWLGWSGRISDGKPRRQISEVTGSVRYTGIDMSAIEHEHFYNRFSNQTLWPLFHYRSDLIAFDQASYLGYRLINQVFAREIACMVTPSDVIWVHDYHLIPLARELRGLGVCNRIGFFLHTPFPPPEILFSLPNHDDLFSTLMDYDLVGLQTKADVFSLQRYIGVEATGGQPAVVIKNFPVSIDCKIFSTATASLPWHDRRGRIIGVDRLDYSKGLPERLKGFEHFLNQNDHLHRRIEMTQITSITRGGLGEYKNLRERVEVTVANVNERYGREGWLPIKFLTEHIPQSQLGSYYRSAGICLVTPLRDGMNLVAKEYVASQPASDPGILILSKFAGAAEELVDALLVNPHDREDIANAIKTGFNMSICERKERWRTMSRTIRSQDVHFWREQFLTELLRI